MSANLDFACAIQRGDRPEPPGDSLRPIGEILPLVLARYEIGGQDWNRDIALEPVGASAE